jgi:hypothetical protein
MNPTVYFETKRRKVLSACEACWNHDTKRDCSGFVREVLQKLGADRQAAPSSMQANHLYDYFAMRKDLGYFLGRGNAAVPFAGVCAHEGGIVAAVWKNPAWTGAKDMSHHGHIALVTEYMASRKAPKPTQLLLAYWGTWSEDQSAEGMKSERMSLSFGSGKHDAIVYYKYSGAIP